jgi:hypothetical protein
MKIKITPKFLLVAGVSVVAVALSQANQANSQSTTSAPVLANSSTPTSNAQSTVPPQNFESQTRFPVAGRNGVLRRKNGKPVVVKYGPAVVQLQLPPELNAQSSMPKALSKSEVKAWEDDVKTGKREAGQKIQGSTTGNVTDEKLIAIIDEQEQSSRAQLEKAKNRGGEQGKKAADKLDELDKDVD